MYKIVFGILLIIISVSKSFSQYKTQLVVAQDSSGDFTSIQRAIDETKSFPDKAITIVIKNGTYNEKVKIHSWNTNLTIEGESREGVIITWDDHFSKIDRGRNSTFMTYTLLVDANDVTLRNLTIKNTSGPVGQAIALSVEGDRCKILNCTIEGNQDTLFVSGEGNRQYFSDCLITGTTDFIFGNATVVFKACEIRSLANSYITAASTEKASNYGLVFLSCNFTADENVSSVYLGRPWRAHARTVIINSKLGDHIRPEGWKTWSNKGNETTTFYAELNNHGAGWNPDKRVEWAQILVEEQRSEYDLSNIFNDWNPEF